MSAAPGEVSLYPICEEAESKGGDSQCWSINSGRLRAGLQHAGSEAGVQEVNPGLVLTCP